jgi:hypothetical protein
MVLSVFETVELTVDLRVGGKVAWLACLERTKAALLGVHWADDSVDETVVWKDEHWAAHWASPKDALLVESDAEMDMYLASLMAAMLA